MAKMYPSAKNIVHRNKSEGVFYEFFKNSPLTKDWTVFYSYTESSMELFGEIDFIALIPGAGILLIELKNINPKTINQFNFTFEYDGQPKESANPFRTIQNRAHHIKDMLRQQSKACADIFVGHIVLFPKYKELFDEKVCQKQIYYLNASHFLNSQPKEGLPTTLKDYFAKQVRKPAGPGINEALKQAARVLEGLVKQSEKQSAAETSRNVAELALDLRLQYKMVSQLPRAFIQGAAGTGKTYMAYKKIGEATEKNKKVLFVCFNILLGKELQKSFAGNPNVDASCVEEYLEKRSGLTPAQIAEAKKDIRSYHDKVLPQAFLQKTKTPKYDLLIVDEFQDLIRGEYIKVLDASIKGGLKSGEAWLFSDFRQNIFNHGNMETDAFAKEYCFDNCRIVLSTNYRNPFKIAQTATAAKNMGELYDRKAVRANGSIEPPIAYANEQEEQAALEAMLDKLTTSKEFGYSRKDIVILSAHAEERSVAHSMEKSNRGWGRNLRIPEKAGSNDIAYTSIHRYKGLESDVVIITDIDSESFDEYLKTLLYTGISRARYKVAFLVKDTAKDKLAALLAGLK